jgi:hypothetical protein
MTRYFLIAAIIFLNACSNNSEEKTAVSSNTTVEEKTSFFPVTSYLKGQIHEIKEKGITPIKYITANNHTDSFFVTFAELDEVMKEFLHPVIDTANLIPFFTESKFLDQSINAFTFTYEPKPQVPDSILLTHWDVYIEPEISKVKRIYLVKKASGNKTLQLTWQSNEWCKTTTIVTSANGATTVEKEEKILWVY